MICVCPVELLWSFKYGAAAFAPRHLSCQHMFEPITTRRTLASLQSRGRKLTTQCDLALLGSAGEGSRQLAWHGSVGFGTVVENSFKRFQPSFGRVLARGKPEEGFLISRLR